MVNTDKKTREKTKETLNHVSAATRSVLMTHLFPSFSQMCHAAELWSLGSVQNK